MQKENKNMASHNLPPNWSLVKLGDVCYTTSGGTPSRGNSEYYNGTIPWVKSGELDKGLILDTEEKISKEALKNSSSKLFPKGTLLIALYGATIGKLAFLGIEAATNQAICGIYKNENIDSNFLFNFLFFKKPYLVKQSIGGAQPNISQGILKNLEIPLPSLPEQKKIVEKIEELFSGLDSGVASLKKAKEQIRLYRQSVLASAFSGRLHQDSSDYMISRIKEKNKSGKSINPENPQILVNHGSDNLPDGWKWVKLGDLTELITKGASPRWQGFEYVNDHTQTLFVTSENVRDNYLEISKPKFLQDKFNEKQKRSILKKGDVLFNIVGASIGRATVFNVDTKSNINQAVALLRLNQKLSNKYLSYYLNSEKAKKHYMNEVVDVARANLSLSDTSNIPIPYCPLLEQSKIVEEIEKRFSEADNLEKAIDDSLAKSETLRQSILKQAFEGHLI